MGMAKFTRKHILDGPPPEAKRRLALKAMFDPQQGNMAEYARFLVSAVEHYPGVDNLLDRIACRYKTLDDILDTLIPGNLNFCPESGFCIERHYPKIVTCNVTNPQAGIFIASEALNALATECYALHSPQLNGDIMEFLPDTLVERFSAVNTGPVLQRMQETFDENGSIFARSPDFIVGEAIASTLQVVRWACMHSQTAQDIQNQSRALLNPGIKDPFGRMISPLEMLGRGENGSIGVMINHRFVSHIDGEHIIRQVERPDQSPFHPKFVEFWFNREKGIGGCPALSHRKQAGEIYMEFGRMFVDMVARAETFRARRAATSPTQFQKSDLAQDISRSEPI